VRSFLLSVFDFSLICFGLRHSYYSAYLRFFESELLKRGLSECLEEYVFSLKANFNNGGEHPAMLSRFIYGVIHPFIHVGCGAEFGLLGVSAEGTFTSDVPSLS